MRITVTGRLTRDEVITFELDQMLSRYAAFAALIGVTTAFLAGFVILLLREPHCQYVNPYNPCDTTSVLTPSLFVLLAGVFWLGLLAAYGYKIAEIFATAKPQTGDVQMELSESAINVTTQAGKTVTFPAQDISLRRLKTGLVIFARLQNKPLRLAYLPDRVLSPDDQQKIVQTFSFQN